MAVVIGLAGEGIEDDVTVGMGLAVAVRTIEVPAAREATPLATLASGITHWPTLRP
jgi:hypothetical protein